MKRFHVHVGVEDLAASIRFYSTLFAAEPSVTKPDYAKWMLDNPRVNFAISEGRGSAGIHHLGIQAEDEGELTEIYGRLAAADAPVLDEGATVCCYAKSTKSWISDPQGIAWETFFTNGESTVYGGNGPAIGSNPGETPAAKVSCGCGPAMAAE
ncbi:MAG TPA: VOC family protein [Pseudolabrys sp.]